MRVGVNEDPHARGGQSPDKAGRNTFGRQRNQRTAGVDEFAQILQIARTRLRPILAPIVRQLTKLGPGHPDTDPEDDLARFGEVVSERALLDIYFVYAVTKRST